MEYLKYMDNCENNVCRIEKSITARDDKKLPDQCDFIGIVKRGL